MFKFFRQLRLKLLGEGNSQKYLIYAVGKIFLVMIGILLALQVNNWSERNKAQKIEMRALIDLKQEFENNKYKFDKNVHSKNIILQENRNFIDIIRKGSSTGLEIIQGKIGLGDGGNIYF